MKGCQIFVETDCQVTVPAARVSQLRFKVLAMQNSGGNQCIADHPIQMQFSAGDEDFSLCHLPFDNNIIQHPQLRDIVAATLKCHPGDKTSPDNFKNILYRFRFTGQSKCHLPDCSRINPGSIYGELDIRQAFIIGKHPGGFQFRVIQSHFS